MINIKEQSEGICPSCEAQLVLGEGIVDGDAFSRDAKCPQCDIEVVLIYDLVFSEIVEK